jgi:uncharacterized protein HemX
MRRPRLPFARRQDGPSTEESLPSSPAAKDADAVKTPGKPQPAQPSAAPQAPADPQERIDGLRAWIAQVERKLGVRTYVGVAVAVLALAAAAVALVLTLTLKQDAATEDDLTSLRDQISAVEQSASQAAEEDVQGLDRRLAELEDEVNRLSTGQTTTRRELKVVQDDIKELRSQVSSANGSAGGDISSSGGDTGSSGGGSGDSQAPPP